MFTCIYVEDFVFTAVKGKDGVIFIKPLTYYKDYQIIMNIYQTSAQELINRNYFTIRCAIEGEVSSA